MKLLGGFKQRGHNMTYSLIDCETGSVSAAVLRIDYRSQEWEQRHHFGSMT